MFPKHSRVTYKMCGDPACSCYDKGILGATGTVKSSRGRFVVVDFDMPSLTPLTRQIHFVKATAAAHLDRLDAYGYRARRVTQQEGQPCATG